MQVIIKVIRPAALGSKQEQKVLYERMVEVKENYFSSYETIYRALRVLYPAKGLAITFEVYETI